MADRGHGNIHSLVVGGTGILRPAVETLEERGWQVTVLARGATDEPPHRFAAAVDAADAPALGAALDDAIWRTATSPRKQSTSPGFREDHGYTFPTGQEDYP